MRTSRSLAPLLLAALLACGVAPAPLHGQAREVVSKQIAVGRSEASLLLEFADGGELSIEFSDGAVQLDGDHVGDYAAGDALETAWRTLLGEAVALDDGPLAARLRDWSPPPAVAGAQAGVARRVDEAFETALTAAPQAPDAPGTPRAPGVDGALAALVERPELMLELVRTLGALDLELDDDVRVHLGEDVAVAAGETVTGDVLMVDGDLEVRGEIDGDVVIVDGALHLEEGGRVTGDVRLADGRIFRNGGDVLGDVANVRAEPGTDEVDRLREEMRAEIRRELRHEFRSRDDDGRSFFSPFRRVGRGVGGIIETLFTVLLVGVLGGGLAVHFGRERLDVVAETARQAPLRAGMVGLAGAFLTVPAWILGTLALIITIVGILAAPIWIVLFPVAVTVGAGFGYLAVAMIVGEWVADQHYERLDWVRASNPFTTVVAGVGALMLAFIAAHVVGMIGFLGFISGLLTAFGVLASVAAALVGFGALLITRGGRRGAGPVGGGYWVDDWDDDLGFGPAAAGSPSPGDAPPPAPGSRPDSAGSEPGAAEPDRGSDGEDA